MANEETEFLRGQAQRCRRLAANLGPTRASDTMLQMAIEYDREACDLEQDPRPIMPTVQD